MHDLKKGFIITFITFITIAPSLIHYVKGVTVAGIDFYTTKDGTRTSDFQPEDTIILRAQSSTTFVCDIELLLYYPDSSGIPALNLGRHTFNFNTGVEIDIINQYIPSKSPSGSYTLRIIVYDPGGSTPVDQNDLPFNVSSIPWELVLAIIIAVATIITIMMIRRKAPHNVIKEKVQPTRVIQIKSTSYYIPKDVDDCHKQLMKLLTQEQLKQVTESKEALDDLERWIIERWLEVKIHSNEFREDKMDIRPNPLANYFRKMLIFNPHNMSYIITESFLAHMRGEDTNIDELVQKAWKESRDSFVKGLIELRGFESVKDIIEGPFLQTGDAVIFIDKIPRIFGRKDLKEVIIHFTLFHKLTFPIASEDDLIYITRHARGHFSIDYDFINRIFTIKDDVSTNGTLLNGMQIKGKGPQHLKNGDIISPAGKIPMKYVQI